MVPGLVEIMFRKKYICDICKTESYKPLTTYIMRLYLRKQIKPITVHYSVCSNCQKLGEKQVFNLMEYQLQKAIRNKSL